MSGILAPTDSKNVPQSLRQKIALAMLMQKRAYPKTFGEGLAAIGDALGDRYGVMGIERDAAAASRSICRTPMTSPMLSPIDDSPSPSVLG